MKAPKFNIDDIVCMKDDFGFNPGYKVVSIGKVKAIHLHFGKGMFMDENTYGEIKYSISGFIIMPKEEDLALYSDDLIK